MPSGYEKLGAGKVKMPFPPEQELQAKGPKTRQCQAALHSLRVFTSHQNASGTAAQSEEISISRSYAAMHTPYIFVGRKLASIASSHSLRRVDGNPSRPAGTARSGLYFGRTAAGVSRFQALRSEHPLLASTGYFKSSIRDESHPAVLLGTYNLVSRSQQLLHPRRKTPSPQLLG